MIKLVLTDLDDTLIKFGLPHATPHALAAIDACAEAGVYVAPATGRIPESLGWMFDYHTNAYKTAVCSNGQQIVIDGKVKKNVEIDREELEQIVDLCAERTYGCVVLSSEGEAYAIIRPHQDFDQGALMAFSQPVHVVERVPDFALVKANIHVAKDRAWSEELQAEINRVCQKTQAIFPTAVYPLLDLLPRNWGKGQGGLLLAHYLGIHPDEVAVFGDSENDLDLLRTFKHSVAVANAMSSVKEAALHHIGASADDAVADALFEIAKATKKGCLPAFMQE